MLSGAFDEALSDPRLEILGAGERRFVRFCTRQHFPRRRAGSETGIEIDQGG